MNAPAPLSCPRCSAPVEGPGLQSCPRCQRRFALYVGAALDPSLSVSPIGPKLQVKSPGLFLMRYGVLDERGIAEGNLDPIIGRLPIDTQGVAWHDIASIAVHRAPAWADLIVAMLIPLPIALGLGVLAIEAPFAAVFAAIIAHGAAALTHEHEGTPLYASFDFREAVGLSRWGTPRDVDERWFRVLTCAAHLSARSLGEQELVFHYTLVALLTDALALDADGAPDGPLELLFDVFAEAREGVAAFLEKRAPKYPDKVSSDMPQPYPWRPAPPFKA